MPDEENKKINALSVSGFTLIELMVVVAIMITLASVMVINLNGQRASRDLNVAENQLVSNLRQIQAYTLSGRVEPSGQPAQFYIMKFDLSKPGQYTIQALYNADSSPQYLENIQTVNLPVNIRLAAVNPVQINRSLSPTVQNFSQTGMTCAYVAFAAPFGKVFLNDGCNPTPLPSQPYVVAGASATATPDDYSSILPSNFVSNIACGGTYGQPYGCKLSTDSTMSITLTDAANTISKTVTVNGITGLITFN